MEQRLKYLNCNKSGKYREILIHRTGVSTFANRYKPTRRPKFANILKEKNFKNLNWEYSNERKEKHNTIYRATKEKAIIWTLNNVIKQ